MVHMGEIRYATQGTGVDISLCRKRAIWWVLLGSIRQIIPQIGEAGVGERLNLLHDQAIGDIISNKYLKVPQHPQRQDILPTPVTA